MDKTIEQVFKAFSHIARELQIYFIPGFLILLNAYIIDCYYYNNSIYKLIVINYSGLALFVISYVLGHICMSFYYVLLELPGIDKIFNKWLGLSCNVDSNVLPKIYNENKESYYHFVERYIILTFMRWTISASLFIIFITDTVYLYVKPFKEHIWILAVISLVSSLFLFILSSKTEKDYAGRVEQMSKTVEIQETSRS